MHPWEGPFYAAVEPDGHLSRRDLRQIGQQQTPQALDQMSVFLSDVYDRDINLLNGGEFLAGLDILEDEDIPEGGSPDITTSLLIDEMRDYYNEQSELVERGKNAEGQTAKLGADAEDDQAEGVSFRIYPNPTVTDATVRVPAQDGQPVTFAVFSVDGRQIFTDETFASGSAGATFRWSLAGNTGARVAPGTYIVRATAGSRTFTSTLVVM